jgi:hypothetical protein
MIEYLVRLFRRWWVSLGLPPRPSDSYLLLVEEWMSHVKKAIVLLPPQRQDEIDFVSDNGTKITARQLTYAIAGGQPVVVELPLDQASMEIGGIDAGASLKIDLQNKTSDGLLSAANSRTVSAPPLPKPVPMPDAVNVEFVDDPSVPHDH